MSDRTVHILITGSTGQLGHALLQAPWPEHVRLHAPDRDILDICRPETVDQILREHRFSAIVNAAAFTAVDRAEEEAARAFAVNAYGPAVLADAARRMDIALVHVSTDYVFDGALARPYTEADVPNPVNVYGASKLAGEMAVRAAAPRSVIMRTAWLVSAFGVNFATTILRLCDGRESLSVVEDQIGSPTSAVDAAEALSIVTMRLIEDHESPRGVFNFVNEGRASRYDLARALLDARGGGTPTLKAISTQDFPLAAQRPANTRLDNTKIRSAFGLSPRSWAHIAPEIVHSMDQKEDGQ